MNDTMLRILEASWYKRVAQFQEEVEQLCEQFEKYEYEYLLGLGDSIRINLHQLACCLEPEKEES